MREHHLAVHRTARYYTLGPVDAAEVWFVCHGYAQLARYFVRSFEILDDGSRLIVAPEALNRYYFETAPGVHGPDARVAATWMTREDREHEIDDYIAYLDSLYVALVGDGVGRVVIALGFSQGAATVSRWAARGRARVDHVILWGSGLAHELNPAPDLLANARLWIALGDADPQIDEARVVDADRRLRAGGLAYELYRYAGGHRIEPAALRGLAARVGGTMDAPA
jgi:predicted esterase